MLNSILIKRESIIAFSYRIKYIIDLTEMKSPREINGKKLINNLRKQGYVIKSQKGSHVSLSNGKVHVTVVLPITSVGVLKQIRRITGIPEQELLL